jgi:hypothetical protein
MVFLIFQLLLDFMLILNIDDEVNAPLLETLVFAQQSTPSGSE